MTGNGSYVDDIRAEDALHVAFVRSPVPCARILSLDVEAAKAANGVVDCFTAQDVGPLGTSMVNRLVDTLEERSMRFLAAGEIESVGQPIAMIVARTADMAADAAEMVVLDMEPFDDGAKDSIVVAQRWQSGNVAGAFEEAAHTVVVDVEHALLAPMALEPRAAIASTEDGRLTVWLSTQTPFRARTDLSRILAMPEEAIRVVAPDVGGAFGGKASLYPDEALVAWAALRLGTTVRWRASRSDEFMAASQGRGASNRVRAALADDGRLLAVKAELRFTQGYWMPYSAVVPMRNAGRILPGPYCVGAIDVNAQGAATARAPVGIYRGAGRPEAAMLMERLMDAAARTLSLDPLEIRRRNLLSASALPFETPTGELLDSGNFHELLDRLEDVGEYAALLSARHERRAAGEIVGVGVALYIEPCGSGWESAQMALDVDGCLELVTGSTAQGQGRETAFAQIVADAFNVSIERVRVRQGDTAEAEKGIGALASRSTAIGGSAVLKVCDAFLAKLRTVAAEVLQCTDSEVLFGENGACRDFGEGASIGWRALADHLAEPLPADDTGPMLTTRVIYDAIGEAWSSGACLAAVSIDGDTGQANIERLLWVDDAGRIINPMLVEGQLIGGMAQGFGEAMMERIVYDKDGQLVTGSLMDYAVPRASDVPQLEIAKVTTVTPMNELGAKGVGEAGCIGVPAAIANAVVDAVAPLGVDGLQMPFTSSTIWQAIRDAKMSKGTED